MEAASSGGFIECDSCKREARKLLAAERLPDLSIREK